MKRDAANKKINDEDLPGYPHYPSDEDITAPDNNTGKLPLDEQGILLPDVSDIPGQENITAAPLGELADTTASSADEEDIVSGTSLNTTEDDDVKIVMGTEADVTEDDLLLLDDDTDPNLRGMLDEIDEDGDRLNEEDDLSDNSDLDVPGSEQDDENERIGEEDEENNYYSLNDDNDDASTEGIP